MISVVDNYNTANVRSFFNSTNFLSIFFKKILIDCYRPLTASAKTIAVESCCYAKGLNLPHNR